MPKASPTESLKAQVPQGFTLLLFYKERSKEKQRNAKKHEKMQKRRRKNAFKNNEMQKNMKQYKKTNCKNKSTPTPSQNKNDK